MNQSFHQTEVEVGNDKASAWPVIVVMLFAGFALLAALSLKPSDKGEHVAAIFPSSMTLADIASVSSALPFRPVRAGFMDNIVIFKPLSGADLEDLKRVGALLIVSAVVDGGCVFYKKDRKTKA